MGAILSGTADATVVDSLNRATTIGGVSRTYDILGNTLTRGSETFTWDALNRMTGYNGTATYTYRADGLRVSKASSGTTTRYRYDGQMGMQDVEVTGTNTVVTNYGLGARGVDFIERVGTSTVTGFPIYDAHGNNVATLTRSGTTYSIGDQRSYDAWGGIRSQQNAGDPKLRYCANLGHKQDDESGLIYMRARYYEPSSGRFISQDPIRAADNWLAYCGNDPVNTLDRTGNEGEGGVGGQAATMEIGGVLDIVFGGLRFLVEMQSMTGDMIEAYIGMAEGLGVVQTGHSISIGSALSEVREAAVANNIAQIHLRFDLRQMGEDSYRSAKMAERCKRLINQMGDRGDLKYNDLAGQIYWLIQASE